jgi:hypothetical protein
MPQSKDPYKVLGITHSASEKEIRNAYRKLVLIHHPDRNNNSKASKEKFNEIQKAYERLRNLSGSKTVFGNTYNSNSKTFYKKVKDIFRVRIILPKTEVVKGIFQIKVFTLHKVEALKLKLPPTIEILEKKAPENIILTTANVPTVAWNTTFVLLARQTGQVELGPASYIHQGVKYESERAFINIYDEEAYKKKLKSEKKLNRTAIAASLFMAFLITTALAYNIVMDQVDPVRKRRALARDGKPIPDFRLPTGAAPYTHFYGNNIKDQASEHSIEFIADPILDQIVFLVDLSNNKVIRHNYILSGDTFEMQNIPDGSYYVKVFFGRDWDVSNRLTENQLQGGFNIYRKFISFTDEHQILRMNRTEKEDSLVFNAYRITLFKVKDGDAKASEIEEERFF